MTLLQQHLEEEQEKPREALMDSNKTGQKISTAKKLMGGISSSG